MAITPMAFIGPVILAKIFCLDQSWNGVNELGELGLCTSETIKPNNVYRVGFQVNAVIPLAAIKLYMLKNERWRGYDMTGTITKLRPFLNSVFEEKIASCGPSINAIVIQINQDIQTDQKHTITGNYPLKPNTKLLLYAERQRPEESLKIFAQPIYSSDEFTSVYHLENLADFSETMSQHAESLSVTQILGQDLPDLTILKQGKMEMDIIREIEQEERERLKDKTKESNIYHHRIESDQISGSSPNSNNTIRKRLGSKPLKTVFNSHTKKPIPKKTLLNPISSSSPSPSISKPSSKSPVMGVEEKKKMIKKLIKETLIQLNYDKKSEETSQLFQRIYISLRYAFPNDFANATNLDESKLKYIIKLHAEFFSNVDTLVDMVQPSTDL